MNPSGVIITVTPPAIAVSHAPGQNVLARDVHRRQRGRARGVHRHAWAAQIEAVGNAVGRDAVGAAGRRMRS